MMCNDDTLQRCQQQPQSFKCNIRFDALSAFAAMASACFILTLNTSSVCAVFLFLIDKKHIAQAANGSIHMAV